MVNTVDDNEEVSPTSQLEDSDAPNDTYSEVEGPEPEPGLNGKPVHCESIQIASRSSF